MTYIKYANDLVEGGPMVTRTTFTLAYPSCARMPDDVFEVRVEERYLGLGSDHETFVNVGIFQPVMDCMGPTTLRRYLISTEELKAGQRYILSNPTVLKADRLSFGE